MTLNNASFPIVEARNLNGRTLTLPSGFGGERNLVLVAFQRWHQGQVDSWFPYLDQQMAAYPDLRVYELPIISNFYNLARPFIDGGMASTIANAAVRDRTLTIYTDVNRIRSALQIKSTASITLLLVDREGTIFWRESGAYSPARATLLERALG
ncbi:TlpA family protein disulfide reductase [Candidatus Chloroploca asiatica]|uniref:Uncharacterized protein n=1 Tax=Candidatus Chloroploca asiatica TaxID=1506545 RepID=A0A2H3L0S9_9CHLR|nr:hypothetical protein [Candidatus Chloroploca asiatica]PDV96747.1 hypothetical protein A9Q02_05850 [Candidatus Chloroploca asiatica]